MKKYTLVLISLILISLNVQGQYKAITGATLINTDGSKSIPNATILINGNKIERVGKAKKVKIPEGAEIIDAQGKWVIPGIIDAHVHFFQSGGLYTRPDAIDLTAVRPYKEEEVKWIKDNLDRTFARYIKCGITSAVDVGGPLWNTEVKKLANSKDLAPRLAVAGPLLSTVSREILDAGDPPIVKVTSVEEGKAIISKQKELGMDLIKIWYVIPRGDTPETNFNLVKGWIDESHKQGFRVAVHATQLETAKAAVRAGADILVHSVDDKPVDKEFIDMVKQNDVIYTTSMVVQEGYPEVFFQQVSLTLQEHQLGDEQVTKTFFDLREIPEDKIPERIKGLMARDEPFNRNKVMLSNLKKMTEAGVVVAMGTDAGNIGTLHGPSVFREFELMTEAGLSPQQILIDATLNSAKVMGRDSELGTIEAGKLADLVILNANPLDDIMNTSNIHTVVKDGKVFKPEDILKPTPQEVVQRQVNAYNARNLDAFLATYTDDVMIYEHPNTLLVNGRDEMIARYTERFKSKKLHAEILDRIVSARRVIDKERVTGRDDGQIVNAVAIYEVNEEGLIYKVWFIKKQPEE
ncbi:MAG: amidohydrolase family protein [Bacteroidota bacterium]